MKAWDVEIRESAPRQYDSIIQWELASTRKQQTAFIHLKTSSCPFYRISLFYLLCLSCFFSRVFRNHSFVPGNGFHSKGDERKFPYCYQEFWLVIWFRLISKTNFETIDITWNFQSLFCKNHFVYKWIKEFIILYLQSGFFFSKVFLFSAFWWPFGTSHN